MKKRRISIKEAAEFHGHLGPYLVLGLLAGEYAIAKLGCNRHFGIEVSVWGAGKRPKSCLIDGLQLATGATYGKGNIRKFNGEKIKIKISSSENKKFITLRLNKTLSRDLEKKMSHKDAEDLARKLYEIKPDNLLSIILTNL